MKADKSENATMDVPDTANAIQEADKTNNSTKISRNFVFRLPRSKLLSCITVKRAKRPSLLICICSEAEALVLHFPVDRVNCGRAHAQTAASKEENANKNASNPTRPAKEAVKTNKDCRCLL